TIEQAAGAVQRTDVQVSRDDVTPGRLLTNGSAIATRSVAASNAEWAYTNDSNSLPANAVSFVYSSARNSPGYEASVLDYSGLSGEYRTQIAASYAANKISFRTKNGDNNNWNNWFEFYHTGNKPTPQDIGALPAGVLGGVRDGGSFDDFTTPGFYWVTIENAETVAGMPSRTNGTHCYGYGSLLVIPAGSAITQVYISDTGDFATRQWWGNWHPWKSSYSPVSQPSLGDIGAYPVGSYYENEFDSRNPAVILGFGVWEPRPGLLYGAGIITDKDTLSLTIPVGPVEGRLFISPANIKAFSGDVTLNMDYVPDHAHGVAKGTTGGGSGAQNGPPNGGSFASGYAGGHTPTGRGRLVNGDIGTQTEPFLIPGYATYRWVRTA
ncbi:hypothetical protein AAHD26_005274, partial [Citrobacter freundii]